MGLAFQLNDHLNQSYKNCDIYKYLNSQIGNLHILKVICLKVTI